MLWQKRLPQNTKDAFVSGKRRSVLWPTGPLRWFLEPFLPLKAIDWVYHKYIKKSRLGSNKIQKAFKKLTSVKKKFVGMGDHFYFSNILLARILACSVSFRIIYPIYFVWRSKGLKSYLEKIMKLLMKLRFKKIIINTKARAKKI